MLMPKVQAEINDANEAYALEAQNINKRTAELKLALEIFNQDAATEMNAKVREHDLKVSLARNANNIAKRQEDAKLLDSQNESAEIVAKKALDRQTLKNDAENALKKLDMELETANMDEHMLRHEALMLAKRCYGGKYIQEATITSFDKHDPSNAVVAGVLAKLDGALLAAALLLCRLPARRLVLARPPRGVRDQGRGPAHLRLRGEVAPRGDPRGRLRGPGLPGLRHEGGLRRRVREEGPARGDRPAPHALDIAVSCK